MINATEAHKLAEENNVDEILKGITNQIKRSAENGEFEAKVRKYGFGELYGGYPNEKQLQVINELKKLGYNVRMQAISSQFIDIYLEITWNTQENVEGEVSH